MADLGSMSRGLHAGETQPDASCLIICLSALQTPPFGGFTSTPGRGGLQPQPPTIGIREPEKRKRRSVQLFPCLQIHFFNVLRRGKKPELKARLSKCSSKTYLLRTETLVCWGLVSVNLTPSSEGMRHARRYLNKPMH